MRRPVPSLTRPSVSRPSFTLPVALLAGAALTLGACSAQDADTSGTNAGSGDDAARSAEVDASGEVTVTDPWVKAAQDGMTGMFGILSNGTDADLLLTGATCEAAEDVEIHETLQNASGATVMQEAPGGLTLPARGELTLEPGGNHVMLMGLHQALRPGEVAACTLEFDDGSTLQVQADVKAYAGAQEEYVPESEHSTHLGTHGEDTENADDAAQSDGAQGGELESPERGEHEMHGDHEHSDHEGHDER